MPMSSMEIAQMNGAYQGAAMNQQHYAGMVGQQQWQPSQAVPGQQNYGSRAASGVAGFASSMAAPAMTIGAGLAGVDPFSMAFRGGAMGMRMGGMAGMAGMAIGGFALASGGAAAAMYGVNQGFTGVQQQQQLQQQLGETYRFRNQFGGQGFTQGGMQNIGSMMRGMTTQQGPMGESTSFEELGRLAQNMARMGMDQGVRNAKDFSDKFRQMVKTLKEVATTMGTSLEEAQKMMGGMKNVGVFKTADQLRAFGLIKAGTDTGILSSSEMMSAGSIGSQISRSIGGTGKAGMNAGLKALSQIGTMQQMGLLTEEQIFNSTGLRDAEGRQALATQQLSSSGRFLGTARGRYFMASIAGKDGQLDPSDVMAYMQGSVSVEETRKRAYSNLRGVGRANFIRNEGRLKGAALEQFGGSADAMALMGWMGERGINVNTDSDRAMLFLQRNLHKGRDEADQIVEQVRNMPQVLRQQISNEQESKFSVSVKTAAAHQGIEAIKHKFAKVQSELNAGLQQAGSDLVAGIGRSADKMLGSMFGSKATFYQGNVLASSDIAAMGGATGAAEGRRAFGWGGGMSNLSPYLQKSIRDSGAADNFGLISSNRPGTSASNYFQSGLSTGGSGVDFGLSSPAKEKLQNAWFTGLKGDGGDRSSSLMKMLEGMGPEYSGVASKLRGAGATNRGRMVNDLMSQVGTSMDSRFADPAQASGLLTSSFTTADGGLEEMGARIAGMHSKSNWLLGFGQSETRRGGHRDGTAVTQPMMAGTIAKSEITREALRQTENDMMKAAAGQKIVTSGVRYNKSAREDWLSERTSGWKHLLNFEKDEAGNLSRAAGEFLTSDGGTSLLRGVMGTKEEKAATQRSITTQMAELSNAQKGGAPLDTNQAGKRDVLLAAGAALAIDAASAGGKTLSKAELLAISNRQQFGDDYKTMLSAVNGLGGAALQKQKAATAQLAEQAGERASLNINGIKEADKTSLSNGVGGSYVKNKMDAENLRIRARGENRPEEKAILLAEASKKDAESFDKLAAMNGKERAAFIERAGGMGGTGWLTAAAQQIQGNASMLSARGSGKGARDKRIASSLGVNLTQAELKQVGGMDDAKAAAFIANKAGVSSVEGVTDLTSAISASRTGKGEQGVAGGALARVQAGVSQQQLTAARDKQDPSYDNNKITADTLKAALGSGGTVLQALQDLKPAKITWPFGGKPEATPTPTTP